MRAIPQEADLVQAQRVKDFFREIQDSSSDFSVLTQSFDTIKSFEKLWFENFQKLLTEYGEQSRTPITPEIAQEIAQVLAPRTQNNLPRRQVFFGRTREMEIVMRALSPTDRSWGILIDGAGGIGKSALALEAAYRASDDGLFDAFFFISAKENYLTPEGIRDLKPVARTLDDFLNETARALGQSTIPTLAGDEKRLALLDTLRSMRTLLIYDNLETLSKEKQEAMADFLRDLPQGCKAIITSRRRGGEGAVWLRVEELDWDAARLIIENEMTRDRSLENKLRSVQERWEELYGETNGSPLALMYILGLMRVRTTLTFDESLTILRSAGEDDDLMKFVYQEVHEELQKNDRIALGALSFFVPSASLDAWMQVADLSPQALKKSIDRLNALSLVEVTQDGNERFTLHPLTRSFIREELFIDKNSAREIGIRFARYWLSFAQRCGGDNYKMYNRLEEEWSNLDATANWLWDAIVLEGDTVGDKSIARLFGEFAHALGSQFLYFVGRWDDCLELSERAYDVMFAIRDWHKASLRAYDLANIHHSRNHTKDAKFWADRYETVWSRTGDIRGRATAFQLKGRIAWQSKDYRTAEQHLKDALAIQREMSQNKNVAILLNELGALVHERMHTDVAERYFHDALEVSRQIGNKEIQAGILGNLGNLARDRKRWGDALKFYEQGLPLAIEVGRQSSIAQSKFGIACADEMDGNIDLALSRAYEAVRIYERLRHRNLTEVLEFIQRLEEVRR